MSGFPVIGQIRTFADVKAALERIRAWGGGTVTEAAVEQIATRINTAYTHPATHSADMIVDGTLKKAYTAVERGKLDGIEAGAEVNVNADWNATSGDAKINNKPNLHAIALSGDHGSMVGLEDDDHPQYLNEARGDARYAPTLGADDNYVTDAQLARIVTIDSTPALAMWKIPAGTAITVGEWRQYVVHGGTFHLDGSIELAEGAQLMIEV